MSVWIGISHFESKNAPHGLVQGNTVNSKSAVPALIAHSFFSNSILLSFHRGTELLPFVQRFISGMAFQHLRSHSNGMSVVQLVCLCLRHKQANYMTGQKETSASRVQNCQRIHLRKYQHCFELLLRQNQSGNWVISIFSGQKPCTRII